MLCTYHTVKLLIKIKSYSSFSLVPQIECHVFGIEAAFSLESTLKKIRGFTACCDWITKRIVKEAIWQTFELNGRNGMQPKWLDFYWRCMRKFVWSPMSVDNSERQWLPWVLFLLCTLCYKNKTWDMQNELSLYFVWKHLLRANTGIISLHTVNKGKSSIPMSSLKFTCVHLKLINAYALLLSVYIIKSTHPSIALLSVN